MNRKQLAHILDQAEMLCRKRGARLTSRRRTVLKLLCASSKPLSAYEILERMDAGKRKPAPPTVYRALDFLLEQGLAHKLESIHAFVGCAHPQHPHVGQFLICSGCGAVCEMENEALLKGLHSVEKATGFRTERPVVELLGTCSQCVEKNQTGA